MLRGQLRVRLMTLAATALAALSAAPLARATETQLPGTRGCVDYLGRDACTPGRALGNADAVAVSGDGRFVYVGARTVAVFARGGDGSLTQLPGATGCISPDTRDRPVGPRHACRPLHGVRHADAILLSPGGRALYVLDTGLRSVAVLARNPLNGRLSQPRGRRSCANSTGAGGCTRDGRLAGIESMALTRDGRTLYAVSPGRIVALKTTAGPGLATSQARGACVAGSRRAGCTTIGRLRGAFKVLPSADGHTLYAVTNYGPLVEDASVGAVVSLARHANGTLASRRGSAFCVANVGSGCGHLPVGELVDLAIDNTGHTLWLARGSTYKGSLLETSTIALTAGAGGSLSPGAATIGLTGMVFTHEGRGAYGFGLTLNGILHMTRDPGSGALTLAPAPNCLEESPPDPSCIGAHGLEDPAALAISPDDRNLYVADPGTGGVAAFSRSG